MNQRETRKRGRFAGEEDKLSKYREVLNSMRARNG